MCVSLLVVHGLSIVTCVVAVPAALVCNVNMHAVLPHQPRNDGRVPRLAAQALEKTALKALPRSGERLARLASKINNMYVVIVGTYCTCTCTCTGMYVLTCQYVCL